MSTIRFMSGPLRGLHLADRFYLVGEGVSVRVASRKEAERIITKIIASRPPRRDSSAAVGIRRTAVPRR